MRYILLLILTLASVTVTASERIATLSRRAERAWTWQEWSSAATLYEIMLAERPDSAALYARTIVADEMAGDTAACLQLVERAMGRGIALRQLIADVRRTSFEIGAGDTYAGFLYRLSAGMPWLSRPLAGELLSYYTFRRDGAGMVRYARVMLAGLPDDIGYLSLLARGYMLLDLPDDALAVWRHILQLDPDCYDALLEAGTCLRIHGDPAGALQYLTRARQLRPTPYVALTIDDLRQSIH